MTALDKKADAYVKKQVQTLEQQVETLDQKVDTALKNAIVNKFKSSGSQASDTTTGTEEAPLMGTDGSDETYAAADDVLMGADWESHYPYTD